MPMKLLHSDPEYFFFNIAIYFLSAAPKQFGKSQRQYPSSAIAFHSWGEDGATNLLNNLRNRGPMNSKLVHGGFVGR